MNSRKIFSVFTCLALGAWLSASPTWSAPDYGNGRGGSKGGDKGQVSAPSPRQQGEAGQQGQQSARGETVRQQRRIELNTEQRHCYDNSGQQGEMARRQARGMAAYGRSQAFDRQMATRQGSALRSQVRDMLQEHDRMVAGFNAADRGALGGRLGKIDRVRDRLRTHLEDMDRELGGQLAAQQYQRRARELERDLNRWNKQHRRLGAALG